MDGPTGARAGWERLLWAILQGGDWIAFGYFCTVLLMVLPLTA